MPPTFSDRPPRYFAATHWGKYAALSARTDSAWPPAPGMALMAQSTSRAFRPRSLRWLAAVVQGPNSSRVPATGKKVAVVGGGPAGLGAAAALAQMGHHVEIHESRDRLGGALRAHPDTATRISMLWTQTLILSSRWDPSTPRRGSPLTIQPDLLKSGFDAVCVTTGLWAPIQLGVENEDLAIRMVDLLSRPERFKFSGRVVIVGGGATALDCALTVRQRGARHVELLMLEKYLRDAAHCGGAPGTHYG